MSFRDCERISFASLKEIATKVKPYRGTDNVFPLGNRKYKDRNFRWHGNYASVYYGSGEICRVHEDESVEFTTKHLHNGTNMLLSSMFWPSFSVNVQGNKGGAIASAHGKEYLIFTGLRLNLKPLSVHATTPYEIEIGTLDRSKTKAIREKAQPEINTIRAFFMASDDKQIIEAAKDRETTNDPFVEFCRVGFRKGILVESWSNRGTLRGSGNRKVLFESIKNAYLRDIYLHEEPFKYRRISAGTPIPAGNWTINVVKLFNEEAL